MSIHMEKKQARVASLDRLLRIHTNVDITFGGSLLLDQADVRATEVLDITPKMVVVAQTSPPVLKSMINTEIEATFVSHDPVTMARSRWGWNSLILGINNEYLPEDAKPDTPPEQAVFIALPHLDSLRATNVRLDYRIAVNDQDRIFVRTNPASQGAKLLNFSAGGVMIAVPGPSLVQNGTKMYVNLLFPWPEKNSKTSIRSQAEVVRVDYVKGDASTKLGLQFQEMDTNISRTFSKIINHYMLAEQRHRNSRA